jgi:hypothetical protein
MEYMFHPPPMLALIRRNSFAPCRTLVGESVIVSETGFCAQIPAENVAPTTHSKID